jgi:primosomal protein N''
MQDLQEELAAIKAALARERAARQKLEEALAKLGP